MSRKKNKKHSRQANPHDVLNGKVKLTAHELIRLIHHINPTGKSLTNKKISELYQLKSQLQSLLIKQFPESLTVVQDPSGKPGLLKLNLKFYEDDACHALLMELDDDARSWAQRQLDDATFKKQTTADTFRQKPVLQQQSDTLNKTPHKRLSQEENKLTEEELIVAGAQALGHYDYIAGENFLRQAFNRSHGSLTSALPLFQFLIDNLASYSEVLALESLLSKQAKKDTEIRVLLALSRAQTQNIEQSLIDIKNLSHPRIAEIYLIASKHYIEQLDIDQASYLLKQFSYHPDPALNQEAEKLASAINKIKTDQLQPVESAMMKALQQDDSALALKLASEILSQDSQNKSAQKIIHHYKRQEQKERFEQLIHKADQANAQGDFKQEIHLLKKCIDIDKSATNLSERLEHAKVMDKKQQKKLMLKHFFALWKDNKKREALIEYLKLTQQQRKQINQQLNHPALDWTEQLIKAKISAKPEKITTAVLTMLSAKEEIKQSKEPDKIISDLEPHIPILQIIPEMVDLLTQARAHSYSLKSAEMKKYLDQAQKSLMSKDIQKAKKCIENIRKSFLNDRDTTLLKEIKLELSHLENIHILENTYHVADKTGDHLYARKIANQLSELFARAKKNPWPEKVAQQHNLIHKKWSLTMVTEMEPVTEMESSVDSQFKSIAGINSFYYDHCVLSSENNLLVVSNFSRWLCIRFFSTVSKKIVKIITLHSPEPCTVSDVKIEGNKIWIATEEGALIELSHDPLDISEYYKLSNCLDKDKHPEDIIFFPNNRILMLHQAQHHIIDESYDFINIDQNRVIRQVKATALPIIMKRDNNYFIGAQPFDSRTLYIYNAKGQIEQTFHFKQNESIEQMLPVSGTKNYLVLYHYLHDDDLFNLSDSFNLGGSETVSNEPDILHIGRLCDNGDIIHSISLADSNAEMAHSFAWSSNAERCFVSYHGDFTDGSKYRVTALKLTEKKIQIAYHLNLTGQDMQLIQSEDAQSVVAVYTLKNQLQMLTLSKNKPEIPLAETEESSFYLSSLPSFQNYLYCKGSCTDLLNQENNDTQELNSLGYEEYQKRLRQLKKENNPENIILFINSLKQNYKMEEAQKLELSLKRQHPEHFYSIILHAEAELRNSNWEEVVQSLEKISLNKQLDRDACHICHLLGIGYYGKGEIEKALQVWEKGDSYAKGECDLDPYIAYASISLLSKEDRHTLTPTSDIDNLITTIFNLYEKIDEQLASKDWQGVINTIEKSEVKSIQDIQLLARHVIAYINLATTPGDIQWIYKIMVLGNFVSKNINGLSILSSSRPMPPAIKFYSTQDLNDIEEQARNWLGEPKEPLF
jgi:hypothetical protein